jgi:hypothetical protein
MRAAIEEPRTASRTARASWRSGRGTILALLGVLTLVGSSFAGDVQPSEPNQEGIRLVHPGGEGGLSLPGGLWLGGDLTFATEVPERGPASTEVDELSLLVRYEPVPRLSLFSQVLLEDTLEVVEDEGLNLGPGNLSVERLYADWLVTPRFTLRAGKFFTPFGLWNVVRRAPLTWTVERPAITEGVFPQHATGLNLIYQTTWHGWSLDATGYGPAQDELAFRKSDELDEDGLLFGGRAALGHSVRSAFVAVGLNAAGFAPQADTRWTEVYGVDLDANVRNHHLTAEFTYSRLPAPPRGSRHGLYVQDVLPLTDTLYGVLRVEYFQPPRGHAATGQLIGLFWRPLPYLIVKADYQFADAGREVDHPRAGFVAAISLIF